MVSIRICSVQSLAEVARVAVLATATLATTACLAPSARATLPVPRAAIVDLSTERAAARLVGETVEVLVETDEKVSVVTSSPGRRGVTTVNLLTYGGETNSEWNTFVYGTAAPEVDRVELDWPETVGGTVVDGTWLVALREKDVTPSQLRWRLFAATGTEVGSGSGLAGLSP